MGKGTRKRETAVFRREEEERLALLAKKQKRNRLIGGILAAVVAVGLIGGAAGGIVYNKHINSNDYIIHNTVVAKSDNYKVTKAMMTYFTASTYMNYCNNYEDQLEDLGLDTSKPLSSQTCAYDNEISWYDYFVDTTESTVTWMLSYAEQAGADGVELTQEYKDLMKETLDATKPTNFGADLTLDDVQACLELFYMASLQEERVQAANVVTEDAILAWADKNDKTLLRADYTYFNIPYGTGSYYKDEETARAMADKMMNSTPEEFIATAKKELLARGVYSDEKTLESQYPANYLRSNYAYNATDGFSDWLFSKDTKVGDTKLVERESSKTLTVYLCRGAAERDATPVVDVRHILFTEEKYETDEAAKAKADEVLKTWTEGAATAESFGELAKKYTEDSNGEQGGLYEGVTQGQMVETFNDWCFDETRKPGDTGVVKTDYGYHVMYFVKSYGQWYHTARQTIKSDNYQATSAKYKETYHVTVDGELAHTVEFA